MITKDVKIKDLTLLERNPRKITKEQMEKLCNSIKKDPDFLRSRPVLVHLVDGKMNVYAGNQRVRAAKKLGWKEIPCIIESGLPDEIIKQRILKDNKTFGEFDYDMLANEWETELLFECGFSSMDFSGCVSDIGDEEADEKEKKNTKTCPSCGHEF